MYPIAKPPNTAIKIINGEVITPENINKNIPAKKTNVITVILKNAAPAAITIKAIAIKMSGVPANIF